MKIGICSSIDNAEKINSYGFDYIEYGLNSIVPSPEIQDGLIKVLNTSGIKCEAFNCFFPWSMILVGPNRNMDEITNYLDNAFSVISKLGGEIGVIGCGGGRRSYEGCTKEQALKDFGEVVTLACTRAKQLGIKIAIEALSYADTDILNTIVETADFTRSLEIDNLGMLADWFHMLNNGESELDLIKVSDVLLHVHIASLESRKYPMQINGEESRYLELFDALKNAGYDKRVSIEGNFYISFEEDAPLSAAYLKSLIK